MSVDSAAMSAVLAQNWWAVALRGAIAILFGLFALFQPGVTMLSLVVVFGAYALVDGIFAIVAATRAAGHHERWGFLLLEGIVGIAAAAAAFFWPSLTLVVFVTLVAVWALFTGGFMLAAAFRLHADHGRWWLALGGIVSILYGGLLIVTPMIGALVLTWWLGAYALIFGVAMIVLAWRLKSRHQGRVHGVGV